MLQVLQGLLVHKVLPDQQAPQARLEIQVLRVLQALRGLQAPYLDLQVQLVQRALQALQEPLERKVQQDQLVLQVLRVQQVQLEQREPQVLRDQLVLLVQPVLHHHCQLIHHKD